MKLFSVVLFFGSLCHILAAERIINCYWGTWANYRPGDGKFEVSNIDPNLCTHLSYAFFGINEEGEFISLDPWLDLDSGLGFVSKAIALKHQNPNLKVLASVGGWNEGSIKYSNMAADWNKRNRFIQSTLSFLRQYGFDGLDLDWEYPAQRGGSGADRENFVTLLREINETFKQFGLGLSIAVAAGEASAGISYDIPAVAKNVDFINVMTYDFAMASDGVLGFNAPYWAIENSINYWLQEGAPADKLVLGIGAYGRTFRMSDPTQNWPSSPSNGGANAGPYTQESGYLGYNEICLNNWYTVFDNDNGAPYAFQGDSWVSFDNELSIQRKMDFVLNKNLGGAMVWSIETDDFRGACGEQFVLLKTIKRKLHW